LVRKKKLRIQKVESR